MSTTINSDGLSIPDSELAVKAARLVAEVSPPFLYHHSMRAFLFADSLGRRDGLKYDRELLYLGAIMHDLGFTERFDGKQRFEVEGADAARAFLVGEGIDDERAEIIWDAVALHTNIGIAMRKRPEIALVSMGTAADTVGLRLADIGAETVEKIIAEYPRLGWKEAAVEMLLSYIRRHPQAVRVTWMAEVARSHVPEINCPGFVDLIRNSPFAE